MTLHSDDGLTGRRVAIKLHDISKVYKLYGSRREQVADSLRLPRLFFGRRHPVQEFHALRGLTLEIPAGERIGIIGRNGAGKTTLLKLITQNFSPTSGEIEVNGTVQALMQMGLGFHPDFSGYENIRSALDYSGLTGGELKKAVQDVIDFVELGEFLHQPMKTYSLGMQGRVQFAAATAINPDILIIDEILGAGDAYFSGKSAHRVQKLALSGCTLLLVSHSTAQILQFCERAIWLERGEIRMQGDTLSVVKAYEEFIERMTREKKAADTTRSSDGAAAPNEIGERHDFATPEWQKDRFAALLAPMQNNGSHVSSTDLISRWPGERGLRVSRVEVLDKDGNPTGTIRHGQPLDFEIEILAEESGCFACRIAVLLMTLEGIGVTRHLSDALNFQLDAGGRKVVRLHYPSTQLASGEFVFSVGLFKRYEPEDSSTAIRYEILSRSFRLKILPQHASEPGIFRHPAEWHIGGTVEEPA